MDLLKFNPDSVTAVPTEYADQVQVFRKIIRRDTSRNTENNEGKRNAVKELAAIWFYCDINSPYKQYNNDVRWTKIAKDIFDDVKWKPDTLILEAVDYYRLQYRSPLFHLLEAGEQAIYKLTDYYTDLDMGETDDKGKYIHSAKTVIDSLANLGKVATDLKRLKEMVISEQQPEQTIRGGFQPNEFSE